MLRLFREPSEDDLTSPPDGRFSKVRSATDSFNSEASRRRSLTSPDVAERAVSPARRRLPASRNSLDQP